jgi:hypothetical protein
MASKEICGSTGPLGWNCEREKGHDGKCVRSKILTVKSIIDGVPGNDKAFPLNCNEGELLDTPAKSADLKIVSSCPRCGSPIYGYDKVAADADPRVKLTCNCRTANPSRDLPVEFK